ncbi:MAG: hypothetical protein ACD_75C00524G0001, partial [uncultured bacterium]
MAQVDLGLIEPDPKISFEKG